MTTDQTLLPEEIYAWNYCGSFNTGLGLPVADMGDTPWDRYVRSKLYWDLLESWADLKVKHGILQEKLDRATVPAPIPGVQEALDALKDMEDNEYWRRGDFSKNIETIKSALIAAGAKE